jgi:hypothetical protein
MERISDFRYRDNQKNRILEKHFPYCHIGTFRYIDHGSLVPWFLGSRLPGFPASRLPGFPASRLPGFPASRLPGFPASRLPGFPASRRYIFALMDGCTNTTIQFHH